MKPIVLISSIVERRKSLDQLLWDLDQQTMPHERMILGSGYADPDDLPHVRYRFVERVKAGCGNRWRLLEQLVKEGIVAEDQIILNIDDDHRALAHAVETSLKEFLALEAQAPLALVYAGFDENMLYHAERRELADMRRRRTPNIAPMPVIRFPACLMAIRAKDIVGISKLPDADILLGPYGDDETLLSRLFAEKGLRVMMSGLWAPYLIGAACFDEHSLWRHPKPRAVQEARARCFEAYTGKKPAGDWFLDIAEERPE